ncbi:sigma 54-interacting transcriptional regulator [Rhodopirellula sp. P2]|uniref:sigma 54-interacting transcriptional regulator n=1 Tax=Rhodopirellula sp. P2 TaxID=2127060 RepID=UPI002367A0A2|nr:sigma 54-interacting transcriptional regulator [Rhodopirellula sp. P2]WDQ15381.1 sigma 54-interacting transcriptional regulator [Rhodopirellula sp. P2]
MTSKSNTTEPDAAPAKSPPDAYLVVHRGMRWTDVIRLSGDMRWTIGRSSSNPIVLRSAQSSRQHAEIRPAITPEGPVWAIVDLNSRNGVQVNSRRIKAPTVLKEADRLKIAGFELTFTRNPATLTRPPVRNSAAPGATSPNGSGSGDDGATQDNLGGDWQAECADDDGDNGESEVDVVSQIMSSGLAGRLNREASRAREGEPTHSDAVDPLLAMAFALGRAESIEECGETLMQTLEDLMPGSTIGLYLFDAEQKAALLDGAGLAPPRLVRQPAGTRYRRPPTPLIQPILQPESAAILARNVLGDRRLATENTAGEIDVESIILAPLRPAVAENRDGASAEPNALLREKSLPVGLVHVTTPAGNPALTPNQLRNVVAAGEIFCQAIRSVHREASLTRSLKKSEAVISRLRRQLAGRIQILGNSEPIRLVQQQIAQVAPTPSVVLVRGESGVGKELVASAIHHAGPRRDGPLVCLNCAALSKDLLESELFGHEEGAFTGATQQKRGKFEVASGGTLMLDEIGEMSLDLQAKLLRVLEGHPFERVGGQSPIQTDVRVVAATHRDLRAMVEQNTFREDLFYRLNVVEILVPPLRERGRDVILLANHFLQSFAESMARGRLKFTALAEKKLQRHRWPGNVRELRNVIERAVVMSPMDAGGDGNVIELDADDLLITPVAGPSKDGTSKTGRSGSIDDESELSLAELEMRHIRRVLESTGGNKSRASTILGIERSTLDRKLKKAQKNAS